MFELKKLTEKPALINIFAYLYIDTSTSYPYLIRS